MFYMQILQICLMLTLEGALENFIHPKLFKSVIHIYCNFAIIIILSECQGRFSSYFYSSLCCKILLKQSLLQTNSASINSKSSFVSYCCWLCFCQNKNRKPCCWQAITLAILKDKNLSYSQPENHYQQSYSSTDTQVQVALNSSCVSKEKMLFEV